jgi:hypothetical protein
VGLEPSRPHGATLPFDTEKLRLLRLEVYAGLVAALRDDPSRAETILVEHGLEDVEQARRIHSLWMLRFGASPELRARFEALVAQCRDKERG